MEQMKKPEITYPCTWSYRLIGEDRAGMIEAIPGTMGAIKHTFEAGNRSSGGKYVTINIEAFVQSEEERLSVFALLRSIATVKMVI
jgi:putative lipoic acid-binding regulatory protein